MRNAKHGDTAKIQQWDNACAREENISTRVTQHAHDIYHTLAGPVLKG